MPTLVGISGYINTTPEELKQEIEGKINHEISLYSLRKVF